ncbi:hypothetical protein K456DRAFT_1771033 [Colletotrichum gloeosporioides 23]|nr:hypothetical protein K456DRAFT_1771033 [Colletotrichum gloeosporioides 23]
MWLIDITDPQALDLVEFLGDPTKPYAILSHTWGDKEVTFDKFNDMTASQKQSPDLRGAATSSDIQSSAGFVKILRAADTARSQGFNYLWVDTCCINKASSAELSESINSMYLWYQKAAVCYAYLSYVESNAISSIGQDGSKLKTSKWFKRGWTLQKLIAPRIMEFYASDWSLIHTKKAGNEVFCQLLSEITGIYPDVLAGTMLLSDVSVADKMRWASGRQTKRAEDVAYCLLGIFDVNMPLLYGEGSRAFIRLQEEILKETADQSLFLWALSSISSQGPSGAPALRGLLANSPDAFSGLGIHHIRPLQPLESEHNEPASMTSRGLRTNMWLVPIDGSDYFAVLDCTAFRSHSPMLREDVCILLKHLQGNQYARIDRGVTSGVRFCENAAANLKGKGAMTMVYVKQKPFYALPEVTIKPYMFHGAHEIDLSSSFSVIEAFPPERFSMTTSVVPMREPRAGQTIVTLRFGYKRQHNCYPLVDISVGLQIQDSEWSLCYRMHPFNGSNLQSVHKDNQGFGLSSETAVHIDTRLFEHAAVHIKKQQHRGRRFLNLEGDIIHQIQYVTRQCCYQDKLEYILSSEKSLSPDGVRTSVEGIENISKRFEEIAFMNCGPHTDMIQAIRKADCNSIRSLVSNEKGLIECKTSEFYGFHPVHWAATKTRPMVMKTLIGCKADLTSRTQSGWLAVHIAILAQTYPTVSYLLGKSKRFHDQAGLATSTGESVAHLLAAYGKESNIGPPETNKDALEALRVVRDQLKPEFNTNCRGELPVHRAAANGNSVTGLFPSKEGVALPQINEVDLGGRSVLFHAACGGDERNIQKLVRMGASLTLVDRQGRGPLHAAVMANQPRAVKVLLELGADPNTVTTSFDLTPLHFSCIYGMHECITNKWSTQGLRFQPIHLAVSNGHVECARELLSAGADINGRCYNYVRLKRPREGPLEETEVRELPISMSPFELAVFVGNSVMVSIVASHSN